MDPLGGQDRRNDVGFWWLTIVGRLKPGASTGAGASDGERNVPQRSAARSRRAVPWRQRWGLCRCRGGRAELCRRARRHAAAAPMPLGSGNAAIQFHREVAGGPVARNPLGTGRRGSRWMRRCGAAPAAGGAHPAETEAPSEPKTLSTADDNPQVTLVSAQTGLSGTRARLHRSVVRADAGGGNYFADCLRERGGTDAGAGGGAAERNGGATGAGRGARADRASIADGKRDACGAGRRAGDFVCVLGRARDCFVCVEQSDASAGIRDGRGFARAGIHRSDFAAHRNTFRCGAGVSQRACQFDAGAERGRWKLGELGAFRRKMVQHRQRAGGDAGGASRGGAGGRGAAGAHAREFAQRGPGLRCAQYCDFRN